MADFDPAQIYRITRPHRKLLTLYAIRCIFTGPGFVAAFPPCFFKYETLKYRFDAEGVAMSWGLLWRHETYVTYARIQDIHLSRGILERWIGLATIHVQTASGSAGPELSIVGLTEFEAVRDFLYSKMRGARFGDDEPESAPPPAGERAAAPIAAAGSPAGSEAESDAAALLGEIRDELRAIREKLEADAP